MGYQVLARKCRPQRFSEIVGQEHITKTLQNALEQNRLGHAYLFVGPRGIGKTTAARILAKALNCRNRTGTEPCCECESCRQIAAGSSLDVMEIDGASHNKVEHVREIRDNVQYTPNQGEYKIYIIDEVHMLTNQAWNALLKTLEEPPPHVKFFFATTEPHKVIPTIVSRCQRLDFKRLTVPLIADRLRQIAEQENVNIDDKALVAIARAADGAMRDAQSIFDQVISFCGNGETEESTITEENVINIFGLASSNELTGIAEALVTNDAESAVQIVHQLADRGRDLERLFTDLTYFLRNIMVYQLSSDPGKVLDVTESELEDYQKVINNAAPNLVKGILENLLAEERQLRMALNKRVYIEVALIKSMEAAASVEIDEVITRLKQIKGNTGSPSGNDTSSESSAPDKKISDEDSSPAGNYQNAEIASEQNEQENIQQTPQEQTNSVTEDSVQQTSQNPPTPASETDTDETLEIAESPAEQTDTENVYEQQYNINSNNNETEELQTEQQTVDSTDLDKETQSNPAEAGDVWHQLIEQISKHPTHQQLKNYMQEMKPVNLSDNGRLQVAYDEEFPSEHAEFLQRPDNLQVLNNCLRQVTGKNSSEIMIKKWVEGISNLDRQKKMKASPELKKKLEQNSFVQFIQELFNAEIIDVRG